MISILVSFPTKSLSNKIKDFPLFPSLSLPQALPSPSNSQTNPKLFIQTARRFQNNEVKFREHIVEYTNLHYDKRHHPQFDT
jgi:hypothetical protein